MPWCVRLFGRWLFPKRPVAFVLTARGVGNLCAMFAIELALLWKLLPLVRGRVVTNSAKRIGLRDDSIP